MVLQILFSIEWSTATSTLYTIWLIEFQSAKCWMATGESIKLPAFSYSTPSWLFAVGKMRGEVYRSQ